MLVRRPRPPLALVYHGVCDVPVRRDRSSLFTRPSDLARHIDALRQWNYRFVTFGQLATCVSQGEADGLVSLTFDDGLQDNLTTLLPLLTASGIPATVFVVAGWLGQRHPDAPWAPIVTPDELRALRSAGVEIGGHSMQHRRLTELPAVDAARDMHDCRVLLEGILDVAVESFAYPYGDAGTETMSACEAAGYRNACRAGGLGSWLEPFNLPRQSMGNRASLVGLRLKRDDRYESFVRTLPGDLLRRSIRRARWLGTAS